jgi:hypothetical protein
MFVWLAGVAGFYDICFSGFSVYCKFDLSLVQCIERLRKLIGEIFFYGMITFIQDNDPNDPVFNFL